MSWSIETTECFDRRRKWYEKKRERELAGVERNLNTFFAALNLGTKPKQIKFGFVHSNYKRDVCSITQGGGGGKLVETRLYLYPDVKNQVLWLLTLGDKNQQDQDVQVCYKLLENIEKLESENEREPFDTGRRSEADQSRKDGEIQESSRDGSGPIEQSEAG